MVRCYGEGLLAPCPSPKLEGHPVSAFRDCLFIIVVESRESACPLWKLCNQP